MRIAASRSTCNAEKVVYSIGPDELIVRSSESLESWVLVVMGSSARAAVQSQGGHFYAQITSISGET